MNKTFLLNSDLQSAKFMGAPPAARGHWIVLQAYCSVRENGGVIVGAKKCSSGELAVMMGRGGGRRAVEQLVKAGLVSWSGDDLDAFLAGNLDE